MSVDLFTEPVRRGGLVRFFMSTLPATLSLDMEHSPSPESAEMPRRLMSNAILIEDGHLILVVNIKEGYERWEPPGGKVKTEEGETIQSAVIREPKEELSVDIRIVEYIGTYETHSTKEGAFEVHAYYCEVIAGEFEIPENERRKLERIERLDVETFKRMCEDPTSPLVPNLRQMKDDLLALMADT